MEIDIDKILNKNDYNEFLEFKNLPLRKEFIIKEILEVEKYFLEDYWL